MNTTGPARESDPETSHEAGKKINADLMRDHVRSFALNAGPKGAIDPDLIAAMKDHAASGPRTRRGELIDQRWLYWTGGRRIGPNGNWFRVWVHRMFVPNALPIKSIETVRKEKGEKSPKAMRERIKELEQQVTDLEQQLADLVPGG